jgi:hypothetical protein
VATVRCSGAARLVAGLACASAAYLAAVGLFLSSPPARWERPAGATDAEVLAAVGDWLTACARAAVGMPRGCPLEARDVQDPSNDAFEWGPGAPLIASESPVRWSASAALFAVDGMVHVHAQHVQRAAGGAPRTYTLAGTYPFSAALRPVSDRRDLGAYGVLLGHVTVDGFVVVDYTRRWTWNCCSPDDPVWRLDHQPPRAGGST